MLTIENMFDENVCKNLIERINQLKADTKPNWGIMTADKMLAHCNVAYHYLFTPEKFKQPNFLMKLILKKLVKPYVTGSKPYKKSSQTAPDFIIKDQRNFEQEKAILINNIWKTQQLGLQYFEGKENLSFGKMTAAEWNTLFYKHLHHHLTQFGV